jgi:Glycogen recognition site of AMP-activated protein kinase
MKDRDPIKDREYRWLTGRIARMPDTSPPVDFTAGVMDRISPKKPVFWRRLGLRLQIRLTAFARPVPAAAAMAVLIGIAIAAKIFWIAPAAQSPVTLPVTPDAKSVSFILDWPSAEKVAVLGSFNNWSPQHDLMHRNQSDGTWQLTIELRPGRYAYVFMVDDTKIIADPRALWEQDDEFGTRNSIITIENGNSDENRI